MTGGQLGYRVELYDAEPNDVARALAARLGENVARCPARARTAQRIPRPVVVHDSDTGTTATLACGQDRATVYNDLAGRPSIIVRAGTDRMRALWRLPLTAGPAAGESGTGSEPAAGESGTDSEPAVAGDPAAGRGVVREWAGRRIRVSGLLRHPLTARWFLSLLSPAE